MHSVCVLFCVVFSYWSRWKFSLRFARRSPRHIRCEFVDFSVYFFVGVCLSFGLAMSMQLLLYEEKKHNFLFSKKFVSKTETKLPKRESNIANSSQMSATNRNKQWTKVIMQKQWTRVSQRKEERTKKKKNSSSTHTNKHDMNVLDSHSVWEQYNKLHNNN